MPSVSAPMKARRILSAVVTAVELVEVLFEIGDEDGAVIVGAKVVVSGQHGTNYASQLLVVLAFVIHKDAGDVFRVIEIAHGAEGDDDQAVVVVVATLHLALINAHHLKTEAVDADGLSERRLAGEKSAPRFVADYGNPGALELILFAEASPRGDRETTNAFVHGIDAGEEKIGEASGIVLDGHAVLLVEDGSDALDHGHFVADVIDVGELKADFRCPPWRRRPEEKYGRESSDDIGSP